jgi:hypothetical protein
MADFFKINSVNGLRYPSHRRHAGESQHLSHFFVKKDSGLNPE